MNVNAPRVLIVEDDENINNLLREALTKHGLNCTQAFSGTEGLIVFKSDKFDLVLLDLMMPGMDGQTLTQRIREVSQVPIIIVSAKSNVDSKVDLLTTGADDFVGKPFELKELIARVDVQLRRKEAEEASDGIEHAKVMSFKDMELDGDKYSVTVKGNDIGLTRQEFKILELFLKYPGKVFSKREIYEYAWNDVYIGEDKTINVHISNIRTKIKKFSEDEYIDTIWGVGFRLSKA
ncbi:MAG: response regulator transcription factor [Clostridiales bacterium]|nr:response regulator transcription factor [Clostridiales bacterium]